MSIFIKQIDSQQAKELENNSKFCYVWGTYVIHMVILDGRIITL